jgi:hypothetical protein
MAIEVTDNFTARIGDTIAKEVTVTDGGAALDLTTYDVRATFRFGTVLGQSHLNLTEGSGITINASPATGKFIYKITDVQSVVAAGDYTYAIKIEASGDEYTIVAGTLTMLALIAE